MNRKFSDEPSLKSIVWMFVVLGALAWCTTYVFDWGPERHPVGQISAPSSS